MTPPAPRTPRGVRHAGDAAVVAVEQRKYQGGGMNPPPAPPAAHRTSGCRASDVAGKYLGRGGVTPSPLCVIPRGVFVAM